MEFGKLADLTCSKEVCTALTLKEFSTHPFGAFWEGGAASDSGTVYFKLGSIRN